jgi:uncharacterized protein (DUF433 family)
MQIINHIVMRDGEARIEGKEHLKAEMVARMYVDGDYTIEDVAAHYRLTAAEVHAAIAYYYDNQAALDAVYDKTLAEIRDHAMTLDKLKARIAGRGNNETKPKK